MNLTHFPIFSKIAAVPESAEGISARTRCKIRSREFGDSEINSYI